MKSEDIGPAIIFALVAVVIAYLNRHEILKTVASIKEFFSSSDFLLAVKTLLVIAGIILFFAMVRCSDDPGIMGLPSRYQE